MKISPPEEAKWIFEQKKRWPPEDFAKEGTAVQHLIPPIYESYGRIFHPFETNMDEPDTLLSNEEYGREGYFTLALTPEGGLTVKEWKADGTVVDQQDEMQQRKEERHRQKLVLTTWRSVAEKYGLTFHAQIQLNSYEARFEKIGWPRNLWFPSEGFLPQNQFRQLLSVLKEHTPDNEVYIFQWPPHSLFKKDHPVDLVRCRLEEVTKYFEEDFIGYLFAADHTWIVYTDTDLHSTLVGGSKALVESLRGSPLEVVACAATTRLDDEADNLNEKLVRPTLRLNLQRLHPRKGTVFLAV